MLSENKIIKALINCEPEPLLAQANPALPESHFKTVSTLSDLVDRELVATIGWAKQIPGEFFLVTYLTAYLILSLCMLPMWSKGINSTFMFK